MLTRTLFWTTVNASTASTGGGGSQLVSLTSLIGYWKLDETLVTSLAKDSHSTNDGSISSTVACGSTGVIGTSFKFDGANATKVTLPNNSDTQMTTSDFTMTAWVYLNSAADTKNMIIGSATDGAFSFGVNSSRIIVATKVNTADGADSTLVVPLNTWSFVGIVFDSTATSNNLTYYLNSTSEAKTMNMDFTAGAPTNLMGQRNTNVNKWVGNIDEFAIWKRKLTAGEMTSLYNSGNGLAYPFTS
jgi:hypothetical protein